MEYVGNLINVAAYELSAIKQSEVGERMANEIVGLLSGFVRASVELL